MLLRCFPRIHIALMDMGNATARSYGGAGFTLSSPTTEIIATRCPKTKLRGLEQLDSAGRRDLVASLNRLSKLNPSQTARLVIKNIPTQHVGLGTKSSLLLGALAATTLVAKGTVSRQLLQEISRRGGASGVGVNAFFQGGFIADAGHDQKDCPTLGPSSRRIPAKIPPVVSRVSTPKRWTFYLLLPPGKRFSGKQEREFFEQNTPVPRSEVLDTIALLYHGVVPAVLGEDLALLKASIAGLHKVGFKRRELGAQSECAKRLIAHFGDIESCAVGVSSMGPLVYVVTDELDPSFRSEVGRACNKFKARLIETCKGRNRGFEVIE
jgi:beta-ribofuranosylaminobenzene 5'-phosphate synthase